MRTVYVKATVCATMSVDASGLPRHMLQPGHELTLQVAARKADAEAIAFMLEQMANGFRTHAKAIK
jgi:hypothetical protein